MKKLIGGAALLFLIGGTGSGAQAAPWCAFYDASTYNCGFHTFEQCLATVRGAGGWCAGRIFSKAPATQNARPAGERRTRATDAPPFVLAVRH
jgi:hypothetical protein